MKNKVNLKNNAKKFYKESKFKKYLDTVKAFVAKEDNYMILLIMLIVISLLFEPYGFTKTLPLLLIVPFFLGIFYKGRKRIMIHTICAIVILASISQDVKLASEIVLIGLVSSFSGLYLAKYLDNLNKYNIFKKIIFGLFALLCVIISLTIYSERFGTPSGYLKAQSDVMNYVKTEVENKDDLLYLGTTYNETNKCYDADYRVKSTYDKITYSYYAELENKIICKELINEPIVENTAE